MKTAISIPDEVFREAEDFAERQNLSRSALYVAALREYLQAHTDSAVTEALDAVYGGVDSTLDPRDQDLQAGVIADEEW